MAVNFIDAVAGGPEREETADWCVCTIPMSVLSQIPIEAGSRMKATIDAVPYSSAIKIGLQVSRRFSEEDAIYGGITHTGLPIRQIAYPVAGLNGGGLSVLLGACLFGAPNGHAFAAMDPAQRPVAGEPEPAGEARQPTNAVVERLHPAGWRASFTRVHAIRRRRSP